MGGRQSALLVSLTLLVPLSSCGAKSGLSDTSRNAPVDWWLHGENDTGVDPSVGNAMPGDGSNVAAATTGADAVSRDGPNGTVGEPDVTDGVAAPRTAVSEEPALAASPSSTPFPVALPSEQPSPTPLSSSSTPPDNALPSMPNGPVPAPAGPDELMPGQPAPQDTAPQGPLLPSPDPADLVGLAFDMKLEPDVEPSCIGDCEPATLIVEAADANALQILWGATRNVHRTTLEQVDGTWTLAESFTLGQRWLPDASNDFTTLNSAQFQFGIDDDGSIALFVSGTAYSRWFGGHNGTGKSFPIALRGTPDDRAPALKLPSDRVRVIEPLYVSLDKPLQPGASARLTSEYGEATELAADVVEGFTVGFSTPWVLTFNTGYLVEVDGLDFSNVGSPSPLGFATEGTFGALEDPSFESGASRGVSGATLVEVSLPPDAASDTMLYGAPDSRVVLRIPADPTATELHFDARIATACEIGEDDNHFVGMTFETLITGGDHGAIAPVTLNLSETLSQVELDGGTVNVDTTAQQVVVPLGGPATGDVLLTFQGSNGTLFACALAGALIDNVHLE